ncbi:hypothetical protein Dimus_013937 [Dionaea muscipula]
MGDRRIAIMDVQLHEKVYVAVGNDLNEGVLTLEWAIKKWASHQITVVILHADSTISMDFGRTPVGKLPASAVSDGKLELIRKCEQEKVDRMLSKYISICGKVKAEIYKIRKRDEPIQYTLVELIMELRITKLVMAMTFTKPSSGKSKSAISGSFYIHQNKPDFCDLYILCGGRLVYLKEKNDGVMEDEQRGDIIANLKQKGSFKGWLGKVLTHGKSPNSSPSSSPRSMDSPSPRNQWDLYAQEIEEYLHQLLETKDDDDDVVEKNVPSESSAIAPNIMTNCIKNREEKIEDVKIQIEEAQKVIQLKKKEAKAEVERQARATRAICLCNQRVEELEERISHEVEMRIGLIKELEDTEEQLHEVVAELQESKNRLSSMLELQTELSNKLQVSSLAKSCAEAQLESAAKARAEVIREIEDLRKQRDILQRRIEFCKEKDAIGMAIATTNRTSEVVSCSCKEFKANEIRLATDDFAVTNRLKSGGDSTSVYKGRINHSSVAVMILNPDVELPDEIFQAKVNLLVNMRHPNITVLIGFCSELKGFVFEYMHNGCLRDTLFSRRSGTLKWHHRLHIAAQVCSSLGFLHRKKPRPIVHGSLNPSNILLDENFLAKINAFALSPSSDELDVQTDVHAFGTLLLQLLCGRNWAGLYWEEMTIEKAAILGALDDSAGEWPFHLAEAVVNLAMKCLSINNPELQRGLTTGSLMKEIDGVRRNADELILRRNAETEEETINVPSIFLCSISQEVMQNPHIAADGFSYELEAIEEWLRMGNDTSPTTNLKLNHKNLIPNHTLRALIQDWLNKGSAHPSSQV